MIEVTISRSKIPYNELPITLTLRSINRKLYRDQYCSECGHPFISISDKFLTILDATTPIEMLRTGERVVEARCRHSTCRQFYRLEV